MNYDDVIGKIRARVLVAQLSCSDLRTDSAGKSG